MQKSGGEFSHGLDHLSQKSKCLLYEIWHKDDKRRHHAVTKVRHMIDGAKMVTNLNVWTKNCNFRRLCIAKRKLCHYWLRGYIYYLEVANHVRMSLNSFWRNRSVNLKKKICCPRFSKRKRTLGHFSLHKNAPAFVFWENIGQHIFFRDLLTFC